MDKKKKKWLEEQGWKVGSAQEFLGLTAAEATYIEMKLSLSENLKKHRQRKRLTQAELAKLLKSSYSQVAMLESGEASVSLDHLVRSLLALGATKQSLAKMIVSPKSMAAI
jgi:DNA-binding XRE family transcriptional regulator